MLSDADFDLLARTLKERSGLVVTRDKGYLLDSRLLPLARARNLAGLPELVAQLRKNDQALAREITEAMTTNELFFFRDQHPFEQFRDTVLPALVAARPAGKAIRIWSAASSSGQEAYSLAMTIKDSPLNLAGWKIEIVGTDISSEILEKAKAGLYSQFEVQRGLPIQLLLRHFRKRDESWQIDPSLRAMVAFRQWNLLQDLRGLGQFDVVFCRNVLIYFDLPTKSQVLENIARQMPADGTLYLGGAETVLGVSDRFQPVPGHRGMYRLHHAHVKAVAGAMA